jgi:hypothetical protein
MRGWHVTTAIQQYPPVIKVEKKKKKKKPGEKGKAFGYIGKKR